MKKLAVFFVVIFLFSCAQKQERPAFLSDHSLNDSLLSARFFSEPAGISFRVPAGFSKIEGKLYDAVRRDLSSRSSKKFPAQILSLWADESGRSIMILSAPKYADDGISPDELEAIRAEYAANLSGAAFFSSSSTHESFAVLHIKIVHKGVMYYKLIFSGQGNGVELSFITPLESFASQMEKYSSVFASVSQLR